MQASGLSPHGVPGFRVVVGWGRAVVRVGIGTVTRRVLVMMVVPTGAHRPERQVRSPSQSFSVSHGSPRKRVRNRGLHGSL